VRYIPLSPDDKSAMLASIGIDSVEKLFSDIPEEFKLKDNLNLPDSLSELELRKHLNGLADKNLSASSTESFLGAGSYNHFIPCGVDHIISRSEWYSAYTPYQPEISQGTLQAIYEYQTFVSLLLGMDVANASMYDGASAMAEAVTMACRIKRKNEVIVSDLVHPRWRETAKTFVNFKEIKIVEADCHKDGKTEIVKLSELITDDTSAIVVQSPNFFGTVEELTKIGELCRDKGILFIVGVAEAMSLGLLKPPGECGADIVIGEGQSFGLPQSFGGAYLGLFATKQKYIRQMPGRLCGRTVDKDGRDGFVLTLSAREQHIRREKATSNICSNQALCALRATIYLSLAGKSGLRGIAKASFNAGAELYRQVKNSNKIKPAFDLPCFNEQVLAVSRDIADINSQLLKEGIIGGLDLSRFYPDMKNMMLLATTETTTQDGIDKLVEVLER